MLSFLEGGGPAADAIEARDWSTSPLGPPEQWPSVLKITVGLILGSRFPQCIVWGPSLITIPNQAFLPILGDKPPALGRSFSDVWSEVWPSLEPIVGKAFAGEATYIEDFALTIDRRGYPENTNFTFCYSPIRDEHGQVVGMLDTVTETTQMVALNESLRLLSGELGHRMKNLLTVVQAVAGQTIRQSADLRAAGEALNARLAALGRGTDVLTGAGPRTTDLHQLAEDTLWVQEGNAGRITLSGPPIRFNSQIALAVTLTLHELLTNATKYGALSTDTGHIDLTWQVEAGPKADQRRFRLDWRESGGPLVEPPARRGFGSVMIERSLRSYFRGETTIKYLPEGLEFTIDAPLTSAMTEGD